MVRARQLDGAGGDVDILDRGRAAGSGVDAEGSAVGKEIQHPAPSRERPGERAVLALIQKEAGLLSRSRVDAEAQTVLNDLRRWLPLSRPDRLHRQAFDLSGRDVVLEPDAA